MTFIFRNRTIFWDISKWNREQKKWDGGSSNYLANPCYKIEEKMLFLELGIRYIIKSQFIESLIFTNCKNYIYTFSHWVSSNNNTLIRFYQWLWVLVSLTSKVSDGCIRDLGFNPYLYQKLISVLVWW